MHLLNLTLQPPSAINLAVYGNFTAPQAQEFVVARGTVLQLLRPNEDGRLETIISTEVFGIIRSIQPFRLTGSTQDYLVVGSDSGKVVVLEVNATLNQFEVRQNETYGKTGCRRITPGQYVAADPKGRAVMVGAVEKQKLVYVMNRDASNRLTISSPLEAHRSHAIHFALVGLDVGFENPIFASLELDYAEVDADPSGHAVQESVKSVVFYELDLGLNHVTRRWSEQVVRSANALVAVPGGSDGPGGVLVLGENVIQYKNENHQELTCALPRREGETRDIVITAAATHKQRDLFFVLLQSELGDLYKISLDYTGNVVQEVKVQYFDTIPVAASLCITKTGLLFAASEFANHYLFQFLSIGDGDDTAQSSSLFVMDTPTTFTVRKLKNLAMASHMESLCPITQLVVDDLANELTPQMYALSGRNNRSTLRVLRHGLPVTEMAASGLPGVAKAVWCLKESNADAHDKYIVVSFEDATLVLGIGETVEQVNDSGFLNDHGSLLVNLMEDDSMLQVHANGVRHIRKFQPVTEWKAPGKKVIERCAANARQLVICLAGGEIIYFELGATGELVERGKFDLGFEVCSLDIGEVPEGRQRFPYVAVGSWDSTVRILALDPNDLFRPKSTLALTSHPHSLCMAQLQVEPSTSGSDTLSTSGLFLSIGLDNGVLQQLRLDPLSGSLTDSRSRFLGTKPVKLVRTLVHGKRAVLALSSRAWLSYFHQTRRHLTPLSCELLTAAGSFVSEQCPEGIVALSGETMKILTLEQLGDTFNQQKTQLRYTPRKAVVHPPSRRLVVIESDHNEFSASYKRQHGHMIPDARMANGDADGGEDNDDELADALLLPRGPIAPGTNRWASCIRILDPVSNTTVACEDLEDDERARSITTCVFHDRGGEVFIIVGTVKAMALHPQLAPHGAGLLRVYRVVEGVQLVLVHSTEIDGIPHAMCEFQGRLLVSVGTALRIYDLGKKKMLRKCENRNFPSILVDLKASGDRVYASDLHESFHLVKYKKDENQLVVFADDCVPRHITCSAVLDYDTIAGGDKFGNIFVSRLPTEVSDEIDNPTGNRILWDSGLLNGAPNKLEQVVQFYVGEVVTSIVRTSLVPGGMEAIVYTTVMGRIGALVPFTSREDVDFYTHLEMYMRQEKPPLLGRDHLSYRSYFIPVKNVTDGDLCEQFALLSQETQKTVAEELDRTPAEVLKKLEDIRNRLL